VVEQFSSRPRYGIEHQHLDLLIVIQSPLIALYAPSSTPYTPNTSPTSFF
jgi:hypothetical protein